jgi:hypothetical protein
MTRSIIPIFSELILTVGFLSSIEHRRLCLVFRDGTSCDLSLFFYLQTIYLSTMKLTVSISKTKSEAAFNKVRLHIMQVILSANKFQNN